MLGCDHSTCALSLRGDDAAFLYTLQCLTDALDCSTRRLFRYCLDDGLSVSCLASEPLRLHTHLSRNQNIVKSFLTLFSYTCRLSYFITSSVHCIFAMPLRAYIVRIMQLQAILRSRRRDEPRPAVEAGSWLQRSPRPPQRMPCECHGIALPPACSHISTG